MPTIDISKKDLEALAGKKFSMQELEEALMFVKGEIDGVAVERRTEGPHHQQRPAESRSRATPGRGGLQGGGAGRPAQPEHVGPEAHAQQPAPSRAMCLSTGWIT